MTEYLNERILPDDYPVYYGYLYVADNEVISSGIEGDIGRLKMLLKVNEIKNCDIISRGLV